MSSNFKSGVFSRLKGRVVAIVAIALLVGTGYLATAKAQQAGGASLSKGIVAVEEYKVPGLEMELSGICPDPKADNLYFVAANRSPTYRAGQTPMLPAKYRGKLLSVDRHTGSIVRAFDLTQGNYGGVAYGEGYLFVSSLEPPEILKVDVKTGAIVKRMPVSGPVGGLEYDRDRSLLLAQLYVGFPHLAVIDPKSGATIKTLWSDESAMDLAKVRGDWLCTWVSGFDKQAFSELRLLDESTGRVKGRIRLDAVHTSMAPLDKSVAGIDGFICMVTLDKASGKVTVRKYTYAGDTVAWVK